MGWQARWPRPPVMATAFVGAVAPPKLSPVARGTGGRDIGALHRDGCCALVC